MKKHSIFWIAAVLTAALLAGCSSPSTPGTADTPAPETTAPTNSTPPSGEPSPSAGEELDLEELYLRGVEALTQAAGDDAPVLFPETDINYLENFYPGLGQIPLRQLYAGVAPVTNAPFEILLVEVENPDDVQTVLDIFQSRVDGQADDTTYPENAKAWVHNSSITSRGNYVFLAVLADPCQIPAEFILD